MNENGSETANADVAIQAARRPESQVPSVSSVQVSCNGKVIEPKKTLLLALSSMIMLGLYYLISMPASVRQHLKEVMPSENFEAQYQLLFTLGFLPGIVLPLFTGALVDQIGSRICLLALSLTCFIGQVIAALGVENESWPTLLTGRLIFGIGFESLFVANETFLSKLFEGNQLGMALGVSSAASYVGYLMSPILSPITANRANVAFAFWLGAIIKGIAVVAAACIYVTCPPEKNAIGSTKSRRAKLSRVSSLENEDTSVVSERHDCEEEKEKGASLPQDSGGRRNKLASDGGPGGSRFRFSQIRKFTTGFWLLSIYCLVVYATTVSFTGIASGLLLEQYLFVEPPHYCVLDFPDKCSSGYLAPENPSGHGGACPASGNYAPAIPESLNVTYSDPTWDKASYVFPNLQASDIDCTDEFWSDACTENYCEKQKSATQQAGVLMSVPFIITVVTSSLFGHYGVDVAGLRAEMVAFAPILLAVSHGIFAFWQNAAIVALPLVLIGLGYSMAVSGLWPSIPLTVPKDSVGTAFGLLTCIQALGNAVFPLVVASIYNHTGKRYAPGVQVFFMACTALVFLVGAILLSLDRRKDPCSTDDKSATSEYSV